MTASHDAAVVLGAAVDPDGRPSQALLRRVAHGIALYHAGRVPRLVMSGGVVRRPPAEALLMRDAALAAGLPAEAVLVETASVDTLGNALFCRELLAREGLGRVLLVTDRSHLPRALYTFRRLGVPADPAPAPAPPWSRRQVAVHLREAAALVTYLWRVERAR
jgi:uncharacterized SAM-binding protein YcdF (DUF218 family)